MGWRCQGGNRKISKTKVYPFLSTGLHEKKTPIHRQTSGRVTGGVSGQWYRQGNEVQPMIDCFSTKLHVGRLDLYQVNTVDQGSGAQPCDPMVLRQIACRGTGMFIAPTWSTRGSRAQPWSSLISSSVMEKPGTNSFMKSSTSGRPSRSRDFLVALRACSNSRLPALRSSRHLM